MNVMLAAGGYPWTVSPVEEHNAYMDALEATSVSSENMLGNRMRQRLPARVAQARSHINSAGVGFVQGHRVILNRGKLHFFISH
jgi:hypothetical protein